MSRKTLGTIASRCLTLAVVLGAAGATNAGQAQDAKAAYPSMAPLDQYRMERDAEITSNHMTIFLIPVANWLDGTAGRRIRTDKTRGE